MASFMTVKRLRTILSDGSLDNSIIMLDTGRHLHIGSGPENVTAVIDFQSEELTPTGHNKTMKTEDR